ncbi:MAG: DUF378 domain-containing protein [Clostridia bacterium]|nr:DUF378 domain-containing protein [Clostridia bacterium]
MKTLYNLSLTLVIIGALNWLLIGLFEFDLVASIFGEMSAFSRIIYTLVGASGIVSFGIYKEINRAGNRTMSM